MRRIQTRPFLALVLCATVVSSVGGFEGCRCGVCDHGNQTELLSVVNNGVNVTGAARVYLAAQRGTTTNKKKRQKPLFIYMCEGKPLPGYPHSIRPPANMRTPRVSTSNPHGLAYGKLFGKASGARMKIKQKCLPVGNHTALFLGDSLTFGTLVQSRFNWPIPIDPKTGFEPNNSIHSTALYWRVAIQMLEERIPSKRGSYSSGEYWWRRAYAIGRGGITASEFNEDYTNMTMGFFTEQSQATTGPVSFVSYFLGINDMLIQAEDQQNPAKNFTQSADRILTEIRKKFSGPLVIGTIPFATDPGRASGSWISKPVWYNWAHEPINAAVRSLAEKHKAGIADYDYTLAIWRKHLPQIDGVHPAWWAHKALAICLLNGLETALEVMPHGTYCTNATAERGTNSSANLKLK
eukprot:TRINITY_DN14363_c0_g1_i2.p1 TRINITY_DN14363_c0_g1~~TRINITY_DN14363_c0_g1_i2.p1  ORF type:complete len:408 (+),score=36.61 TRINITY_DN14363_c0_g1_i2:39-1262(+)